MKRKIIPLIALTMFASLLTIGNVNSSELHQNDLIETTLLDNHEGVNLLDIRKSGSTVECSPLYSQYGQTESYFYIRFVIAVKNTTNISFERKIRGDVNSKTGQITTVYSSITASGNILYYTDEGYTRVKPETIEYYWATYTIQLKSDADFQNDREITLNMFVDGIDTALTKTTSFSNEIRNARASIVKEPTYTETGLMENGDILPVLNDIDYNVTSTNGFVYFEDKSQRFVIIKELHDKTGIYIGDKTYNDVTINFANFGEGLKSSYEVAEDGDSRYKFNLPAGKVANMGALYFARATESSKLGYLEFSGRGTFNITGSDTFKYFKSVVVGSGVTLNVNSTGIAFHTIQSLKIEDGAIVNITSNNRIGHAIETLTIGSRVEFTGTSSSSEGFTNCGSLSFGDESIINMETKGVCISTTTNSITFGKGVIADFTSTGSVGFNLFDTLDIKENAIVTINTNISHAIDHARVVTIEKGATLNAYGGAGDGIRFDKDNASLNIYGTLNIAAGGLDENGKALKAVSNPAIAFSGTTTAVGAINFGENGYLNCVLNTDENTLWNWSLPNSGYTGYQELLWIGHKVVYSGASIEQVSNANSDDRFRKFTSLDGTKDLSTAGFFDIQSTGSLII